MQLSPFWEYQSWHHRRFMAQLPVPKRPKFDSGPIKVMRFAVWNDTDPTRSHRRPPIFSSTRLQSPRLI